MTTEKQHAGLRGRKLQGKLLTCGTMQMSLQAASL